MPHQNKYTRRHLLASSAVLAAAAQVGPADATITQEAIDDVASPNLKGRTVLITGCSSGFGRLGAQYYARCGARVFATMRNLPREEGDALRAFASDENLSIEVIELDVLSDASVQSGVDAVLERTGGTLDVLVNNAGVGVTGPVEAQDMEATRLAFETNVYGCQRMVRAVLPAMRAQKSGLIVPISSQIGRLVVPGAGHYCATKFALEAMSEQLAYELVAHNIDVSIIQPGGYPTKIWINRNRYTSELKSRLSEDLLSGYPAMTAAMGKEDGTVRSTDPMDIPRAIAAIMAMPDGQRPLRRAVHPTWRPQEAVNAAMAQSQRTFLANSPFDAAVRAVQDR